MHAKHAYGAEGSSEYNIPANTDLVYEITLNKFEKVSVLYCLWIIHVNRFGSFHAKYEDIAHNVKSFYKILIRYLSQ